jgi:dipeptidyl aminopeptidase/acylaminoacyl peptidase
MQTLNVEEFQMKRYLVLIALLLAPFAQAVKERTANNGNLVMQDVPEIPESIVSDLNRYQNVRSAPFRDFSFDGEALYISTRFGDVSQLHKVEKPGGARQQLTFFKEPIGSVSRQPDGDKLAFTMDAGGSEYAQIFLFDPTTGESEMLTDGQSRNGVIKWSHSGGKLAYQSTQRNGRSNDLWILDSQDKSKNRMIMGSEDGAWWGVTDWDSNDLSLLAQEYISASDSRVYVIDMDSGKKTLLEGNSESPSVNYALNFSFKDKGYFLTTNQDSEYEQLAYRDLNSGKLTIITKDIEWNVDSFALSKDRKRAAFTVNQDGMDILYLMDAKSFKYKVVETIPVGLVSGLTFSIDSKRLGMTLNTPQTPSDSFVLELKRSATAYGALSRWTFSEVGGLNTENFSVPELVRYKTFDDRHVPAFIYKPKSKGPHPVIISIHGGPESQFRPAFRSTYQLWIDKLGAAVIAPNVRGSAGYGKEYIGLDNGFKREDSVKDIGALLDWIATQPDLDQNRVAVIGGSYGGYMVLASAVHYSERLKAAVDIVGISNFVTFLQNTKDYRRDLRRAEYGDERIPAMHDHLQAISPSNNVDKINVPMFVVQGENDPRVPVTEAEQIVEAMRSSGKPVWYMNALNEGHGYRKKENRDLYQQAVVLFFQQNLL